MKIVLITSGQPSLNPRLVKEADVLCQTGHEVIVLYTYWNDWGTTFDDTLLKAKKWKAIRVGGDPKQKPLTYLLSRIMHKLAIVGARKIGLKYFAEFAISRNSYSLMKAAAIANADLYIAHNLGALPAVVKAAKLHGKPSGFDAEDFHRNEVSNDPNNFDVRVKTHIENKYIPDINYLTTSSPQIADAYHKLFPTKNPIPILNVFNKVPSINIKSTDRNTKIKLLWFSQTIGTNRGIEDIIKALNDSKSDKFELHLLGNLQHSTKEYFENRVDSKLYSLHFHNPVAPDELITFSSQFDIGLALEPAFSINNNIALSNKIFTYMHAGLAIIASNTTAQGELLKRYPEIGKLYEIGNIHSLLKVLLSYSEHTESLYKAKKASLTLAHDTLNWETEKLKFLKIIRKVLTS